MWWSFQVFLGAESPRRTGNGWKNVEENKVQSANAQVSNSVIFRIKCRAQEKARNREKDRERSHRNVKNQGRNPHRKTISEVLNFA